MSDYSNRIVPIKTPIHQQRDEEPKSPRPKLKADRHNQGKPKISMISSEFLLELTKVLEYGAKKYSRDNWKKGLPYTEVIDSLTRHLLAFKDGEDIDDESKCLHLGHIAANTMFLTYYLLKGDISNDDR